MIRILTFLILFTSFCAVAQIKSDGTPISNGNEVSKRIPTLEIKPPSAATIENALLQSNIASIVLDSKIDFMKKAYLTVLDNGDKVYRLSIKSNDAKAINIYYDNFVIPAGGKLYIYNPSNTQIHGAYTSSNNLESKKFTHDYITGDQLIIEYNEPSNSIAAKININQIGYFLKDTKSTAASASCEVNINCPEGDDWQDEKKGVVRLLIKIGSQTYWCSGSLINNTDTDCTPYILSAEHCTSGSAQADNDASIVYFNFESIDCSTTSASEIKTMTGFDIVSSGPASGSDFVLMKLKTNIPDNYNPYFNGWKKDVLGSNSGVSIHHPSSDIKKISTYTEPLLSTSISGGLANGYWGVTWASTTNGHGITEGGSSGSPIFDDAGLIIGTLTGGNSYCATPTKIDFYGKLGAHWNSSENGDGANSRLSDWLDPSGFGTTELKGTYKPCTNSSDELTFNKINVWPNPSSSVLNITIEHNSYIQPTILIHDLLGKVIFKKQLQNNNKFSQAIPIDKFTAGNYILSITTSSISNHQSIIISR